MCITLYICVCVYIFKLVENGYGNDSNVKQIITEHCVKHYRYHSEQSRQALPSNSLVGKFASEKQIVSQDSVQISAMLGGQCLCAGGWEGKMGYIAQAPLS